MIAELSPTYVRQRETFNFVTLEGEERRVRISEWQRVLSLVRRLLAQPYEWKLAHAQAVIAEALRKGRRPAVAWSGGRGSTVVLHLVLQHCQPAVLFANTRVEFKETVRFVREVARRWNLDFHMTFPERGVTFWKLIEEFGLPLLGKAWADTTPEVWQRRARKRVQQRDEAQGRMPLFPQVYDFITHPRAEMAKAVRMSNRCCYHLKEKPQTALQRRLGVDVLFLGIQAEESNQRLHNYAHFGELYWARKSGVWKALPVCLWTQADLQRYEAEHGLPVNPLYGMGYSGTGCWPCMMNLAFDDNQAQALLRAHPRLHRFLMTRSPVGEAIARLKAIRQGLPPETFIEQFGLEWLYERRPCWFNRI